MFGRAFGDRDEEEESFQPGPFPLDVTASRWLRRHLAGGVVALTTVVDGSFRAATLTACLLTSLDPLQFLVSIEVDSQIDGWLRQSGYFGLSFLPWQQQFFADQFAGLTPLASRHFRGIEHFTAATGAPLLTQSIAWADCRIVGQLPTGDHQCYVGEAIEIGRGEGDPNDPLIYFLNRYRRLERRAGS